MFHGIQVGIVEVDRRRRTLPLKATYLHSRSHYCCLGHKFRLAAPHLEKWTLCPPSIYDNHPTFHPLSIIQHCQ